MKVKVYGASDDLIEVEGGIEAEFAHYDDDNEKACLAFSDGTLLRVRFADDGIWRITTVRKGASGITKDEAIDGDNHTDVVTLDPDRKIEWVALVTDYETAN